LISELFPTHVRATATAVTGSLAVTTAWLISPLLESYLAPLYGWTAAFMSCAVIPLALGGIVFLALVNLPSGISIEDASSARESQPYRRCLRAR
jgi:MFS family permease